MNKLTLLENMGFKITWKLIIIGLYGFDKIPSILTNCEMFDYLDSLLAIVNEQTDNIISLICTRDNDFEIAKLLKSFANDDKSKDLIQIRKWRAFLLKNLLDDISRDCLQGLLDLMEFWISMGIPEDCPHVFPDSEKASLVQDYFSQSKYNFLVNKNRIWLDQEIAVIIKAEEELNCLTSEK